MIYRGRAETGWTWLRAGWPFAKLEIQPGSLEIRAPIMGSIRLVPDEVIRIETTSRFPFWSAGLLVVYRSAGREREIRFFCLTNPKKMLSEIKQHGFATVAA